MHVEHKHRKIEYLGRFSTDFLYFGINKNAHKGAFQVSVITPKPTCSQCPVTRKQNTLTSQWESKLTRAWEKCWWSSCDWF